MPQGQKNKEVIGVGLTIKTYKPANEGKTQIDASIQAPKDKSLGCFGSTLAFLIRNIFPVKESPWKGGHTTIIYGNRLTPGDKVFISAEYET